MKISEKVSVPEIRIDGLNDKFKNLVGSNKELQEKQLNTEKKFTKNRQGVSNDIQEIDNAINIQSNVEKQLRKDIDGLKKEITNLTSEMSEVKISNTQLSKKINVVLDQRTKDQMEITKILSDKQKSEAAFSNLEQKVSAILSRPLYFIKNTL